LKKKKKNKKYSNSSSCELLYLTDSILFVTAYVTPNNNIMLSVLPPLLQELESLGISITHICDLNDDKELENLADNLKREFLKAIKETKENGSFVNPGAG